MNQLTHAVNCDLAIDTADACATALRKYVDRIALMIEPSDLGPGKSAGFHAALSFDIDAFAKITHESQQGIVAEVLQLRNTPREALELSEEGSESE